MKKLKSIISLVCVVLLILSAAVFSISVKQWSKILPASSYEDQGVRLFKPYNVLPVQVQNSGAIGRDRRTNPSKTVYMVYYQATDGSGYQWSDETLTQSMGQEIVNAGQTVERRVLRIPEEGTYITVEPTQTAESYTASLRERYNLMCGFAVIYIFLYIVVRSTMFLWKRLIRRKREPAANPASSGPEIPETRPRLRVGRLLLFLAPVAVLAAIAIGMSRSSTEALDMDFGWNGNVWTSEVLGLRYTLPASGEKYDLEKLNAEREAEFGPKNSAGKIVLSVSDPVEGSTLSLTVVPRSRPSEADWQKSVELFAQRAAQDGSYDLEELGEETLAGQTWHAWRIETPERGIVHYYLSRQSGAFWLILLSYGPMAETPPALLTCFDGETSFQAAVSNPYLPPADEDGYLVATFPPELLGNETPEEIVAAFQEDLEKARNEMTPEELEAARYWNDVVANEDGSVSYYFTPEQYQRTKKGYYAMGIRVIDENVFGFNPSDIVKRLEYNDVDEAGIPWEVTAWVNQAYFQSGGTFSDFVASFVPMTLIGRYQIMCGVPAEEWAVHVTVRDADTENVLYEEDFPEK